MRQEKRTLAYGTWPSPIGAQSLAEGIRLTDVAWDSDGTTLVWREERSDRGVLVCLPATGEAPRDLTSELSVRARVGYGGGDFTVAGGMVYFVEANGRLYRQPLAHGAAAPLTPAFGHATAPTVSPDHRFVAFVHTYEEQDCLAIADTDGRHWPQKLVSGADFYMQPCWHPQGDRLAWVAWNHPQMPWEGSRLQLGTVCRDAHGLPYVADVQTLAGSESIGIFQPTFSPDGRFLAYISNESGWDSLYLYDLEAGSHRALLADHRTDIGQPAWAQGMRTYGFRYDGKGLYYLPNEHGVRRLWLYDLATGRAQEHHTGLAPYTFLEQPALAPTQPLLACIASAATLPSRIITLHLGNPPRVRICRRSTSESVPPHELSSPQRITWSAGTGERIYGLFYPPQSTRFQGRGKPPVIILIHGGPTSQAVASYQANVQFFSTRGFAVLQVNHRGSTGYGKAYVDALRGQWGIADTEDAVSGAQYLVQQGWVEATKLVIMGGSAGGYTVLQALVQHPGFFKAGICLYGISNLFTLAASTHKFEAHYLDSLIGPLPEAADRYRDRSPLFAAQRICDPIALFQGDIDQVVPKDQAEAIVASLAKRGVPHEYHVYVGEGHGFRKTATIAQFYTAVEAFLRQYVLFA
jgi:dipeptidyl aminopeptidase/acylaminoacyl peptidase